MEDVPYNCWLCSTAFPEERRELIVSVGTHSVVMGRVDKLTYKELLK